ncbi:MAG: replicative DNA helicase [Hyphomicrobiaceae bacterium]
MSVTNPKQQDALLPVEKLRAAAQAEAPLTFRQPPHNIEAEQALLGAILVNNDALDRVADFLRPEHFYDPLHAEILDVAAQLIQVNKQANPITLKTFFENAEPIDQHLTVPQYLGRLAAAATSIINAHDYGRTIYDLAIRRRLIDIGTDLVNTAYDSPVDQPPETQIGDAESRLYELAESGKYGQGFQNFGTALTTAINMADSAFKRAGHLSGLATGLTDLDRKMGGLQNSDLIILAGRPSMGKTALVTNIAYNVARHFRPAGANGADDPGDGAIVGFFSLEMSAEQLATRILSEQSEIASEKIRRGMIEQPEFDRLVKVSQEMGKIPLYIDQTGGITIAQLSARARKLKRQKGLGLLIVDYLQLLAGSSKSASAGRVQEITEITTGLKALAKELEVPIIALSQLSRQVEQRDDKRPQLSDLRESGSIEQDADVVMFVFREEYYVERKKPAEGTEEFFKWQQEMDRVTGRAEVIIGKQRHGPVGTVGLSFESKYTRFGNLATEYQVPDR